MSKKIGWMRRCPTFRFADLAALQEITRFWLDALGTAAACGLVLYFVSAAGAHIRGHDTRLLNWVNWAAFFSLAVAALAVGLAYRGPW